MSGGMLIRCQNHSTIAKGRLRILVFVKFHLKPKNMSKENAQPVESSIGSLAPRRQSKVLLTQQHWVGVVQVDFPTPPGRYKLAQRADLSVKLRPANEVMERDLVARIEAAVFGRQVARGETGRVKDKVLSPVLLPRGRGRQTATKKASARAASNGWPASGWTTAVSALPDCLLLLCCWSSSGRRLQLGLQLPADAPSEDLVSWTTR